MATVSGTTRALYAVLALLLLTALHTPGRLAHAAFPYRSLLQSCQPSGSIPGRFGDCNTENGSECCKDGQRYTTYSCSPPVTAGSTSALLTFNNFTQGGDGGGAAACTGKFYDKSETVVALSTGWYNRGSRCTMHIVIRASNGNAVRAMVVDECDSKVGCDEEHNFEPPCRNNIVDGSQAVWDALGLNADEGQAQITWSDE